MGTSERRQRELGVGRLVDYVRGSERRRLALAAGVSALFLLSLLASLGPRLGPLPFALAGVLFAYLYTRHSAVATVVAGALGPGVLCLGLFGFQAYWTVATVSTEPVASTFVRLSGWLVAGLALVALGAWLRSREF